MPRDGWMTCTFQARPLPEVIVLDGHSIVGPFCAHCGGRDADHGPRQRCPRQVGALWPTPSCTCHCVTNDRPKRGTNVRVVDVTGTHRVFITEEGKARRV